MDSRKLSYDDCVKAIGGDEFRSAAEMQYHVNFAIEKGLVALAQQAQPCKHGWNACPTCHPEKFPDWPRPQQAQPEMPTCEEAGHHKSVAALPPDAVPTLCPGEDQRDNSGPIAAPQERQHE